MKNFSHNISGNTTILVLVLSLAAMTVGITIATSQTESIIASKNLAKASTAYLEAEGNVEEALYIYAGHDLGFEASSHGVKACENTIDIWCLETQIAANNGQLEYDLKAYDFIRLGLYNDTADHYIAANNVNIDESSLVLKIWDGNTQRKVGIGDMRVNSFNGFNIQSLVKETDWDVTTPTYLAVFPANSDIKISGNDHIWEKDSVLYRDLDNSNTVSIGDIRITAYLDYPANSAVSDSDDDKEFFLHSPENLSFKCSSQQLQCPTANIDTSQIYASKTATITILSKVDGESDSWTRTLSKNQTTSDVPPASGSGLINSDTIENTNISPGRNITELFASTNWNSINSFVWPTNPTTAIDTPLLQINTFNTPLTISITHAAGGSQITSTTTILKAENTQGGLKQSIEIKLSDGEIIPIFGIGDVIH